MHQPTAKIDPFEHELSSNPTELARYQALKTSLGRWRHIFAEQNILDFGASSGLSISALLYQGAKSVIGIEPDESRVLTGRTMVERAGLGERATLMHIADTRSLPFENGYFGFVLANAVLEHIPQPREEFFSELWRLVSPGGHLMVNETPNKYFPKEIHTTHLWFNHWLPKNLAYRRAIQGKRFRPERTDWGSSGWRGIGYFELVAPLSGYRLVPENSRPRHRLLSVLGIPASIFDPYPTWILRKD